MEWPFDETGEFRNQHLEYKDFTGTTVRESRLNSVRLIGVEMIDAEIDGYIENLVVNDVRVMPLVEAELDRLPDTTAVRCLRVVLDETWAHHRFAVRDLETLGATDHDPG